MSDIAALMRRFDEAMTAKDARAAASMSPEEVIYVDHRPLGWSPVYGRSALEEHYRSILEAAEDFRVVTDVLEEVGEQALMRQTATFRAQADGGGGEGLVEMITLVTVRDGGFAKVEIFEDKAAARSAMGH